MYRIVLNETSYYGAGCRSVIAEEVRKRGFRKALLVTDKDLIRFGVAEKIERVLADAGIPYEIYSEIKANPTIRNVQQGVEAFKRSGADFMVALGGGSSIDTAKAVGIPSSPTCVRSKGRRRPSTAPCRPSPSPRRRVRRPR